MHRGHRRKRHHWVSIGAALLLGSSFSLADASDQDNATPTPSFTPSPTPTSTPTPTPSPTPTPTPTATPTTSPTATPAPTPTLSPTVTPLVIIVNVHDSSDNNNKNTNNNSNDSDNDVTVTTGDVIVTTGNVSQTVSGPAAPRVAGAHVAAVPVPARISQVPITAQTGPFTGAVPVSLLSIAIGSAGLHAIRKNLP